MKATNILMLLGLAWFVLFLYQSFQKPKISTGTTEEQLADIRKQIDTGNTLTISMVFIATLSVAKAVDLIE